VHDLLPHPATAGEITQIMTISLLIFCRFTHCTKLPWALLPMFLFSAVQSLSPFFAVLGPMVWPLGTWH